MQVIDIMDKTPITITTDDSLQDALRIMRTEGLRAVPVVGPDGNNAGVLRLSRLLPALPEEILDESLEETFPASDPIAPGSASEQTRPIPRHRQPGEEHG